LQGPERRLGQASTKTNPSKAMHLSMCRLRASLDQLRLLQSQDDPADARVLQVKLHAEPELAAHAEHGGVVGEHRAVKLLKPLGPGVVDQDLHQPPAQATALEVGAHE